MELLVRAVSGDGGHDWAWWPLVEAEREAMEDLDVPLFTARADGTRLTLPTGRELDGFLSGPSADFVAERLRGLGPDDLEQQLGFVAGSLYASSARHWIPTATTSRVGRPGRSGRGRPVPLERVAAAIAAELAARAIRGSDGGACWIAPQYLPRLERYQLQPIAHDLHSGACGIVLFLAAVERVTGGGYRDVALGALEPLREALDRDADAFADGIGFGGATGLGSVVYALTRASGLLEEPALLGDAATAAALVTDERIAHAPKDVFDGLAGAILGLLALHSAEPQPVVLERADACGRRLLEARAPGAGGHLAWVTFRDRLLTGFSHGAAGIAYALIRLHAATGDAAYRSAAVEAIAHEDELFAPELGNWADLREDEQPAYKANWCHGAPGIGLARLGGLGIVDTPEVRRDVGAAVETTLLVGPDGPDHLCCGNLGRADTLLVAGQRLGRPDLLDAGRARIEETARRAQAAGGFSLHQFLPRRVYVPGFWQGLSGVGYELLRAVEPELLPSVLLWE